MIDRPGEFLQQHGFCAGDSRVLCEREGREVLRIDTPTGPVVLKVDLQEGRLKPDVENVERLRRLGVPVPEILGHGEAPSSHVVLRWIEGSPLTSDSPITAQREAGELLQRLHRSTLEVNGANGDRWAEWMQGWMNHALTWWGEVAGASAGKMRAAREAFDRIRPALPDRTTHPILFDGRPEHFLVRDGHLVGIIDLTDVRLGDGAMDLAVLGLPDPELLRNVLEGYGPSEECVSRLDRVLPFYVFLRRLAAAEWNRNLGDMARAAVFLRWIEREPFPDRR